jgi:hypothetical protein
VNEFKAIARQLKNALRKPEKYKLYYAIFVRFDSTDNDVGRRARRDGAEIPAKISDFYKTVAIEIV